VIRTDVQIHQCVLKCCDMEMISLSLTDISGCRARLSKFPVPPALSLSYRTPFSRNLLYSIRRSSFYGNE